MLQCWRKSWLLYPISSCRKRSDLYWQQFSLALTSWSCYCQPSAPAPIKLCHSAILFLVSHIPSLLFDIQSISVNKISFFLDPWHSCPMRPSCPYTIFTTSNGALKMRSKWVPPLLWASQHLSQDCQKLPHDEVSNRIVHSLYTLNCLPLWLDKSHP